MEALILEIATRGLYRYEPVTGSVTTIGRALDNDIILSDPTVAPHHLKIIQHPDDALELVNLTDVNPARIDGQRLDQVKTQKLPLTIELGRVQAQLKSRREEVAPTRPLAGNGRTGRFFANALWSVLLVIACLLYGGLDFYLGSYTSFNGSDLIKYVLRETVLSLGALIIALSILERLLVHRWEIRQLVTSVCLAYLCYQLLGVFSHWFGYLISANWPATAALLTWFLFLLPASIALYLVHISHLKRGKSILLAILISSPVALPALLQSGELKQLLDDFSNVARYQNSLSSLNWHLDETVGIEEFARQARDLQPGEFAD